MPWAKLDSIPIEHANIAAASPVKALVIGLWLHLDLPFELYARQVNVLCHTRTFHLPLLHMFDKGTVPRHLVLESFKCVEQRFFRPPIVFIRPPLKVVLIDFPMFSPRAYPHHSSKYRFLVFSYCTAEIVPRASFSSNSTIRRICSARETGLPRFSLHFSSRPHFSLTIVRRVSPGS